MTLLCTNQWLVLKLERPVVEVSKPIEEVKKTEPVYDDLDAYQKKRDAERKAELDKAR